MSATVTAEMIRRAAEALCALAGYDAGRLEPGNIIVHPLDDLDAWEDARGRSLDDLADSGERKPDGFNRKGEPCHFMWRQYIGRAQVALRAALIKP